MNKLLHTLLLIGVLMAPAVIASCGGAAPAQEAQVNPTPPPTDKPPTPQPIPAPRPGPTDTGDPGPEKAPPG